MRMTLLHNMDDIGCGKSTQHGEIKKKWTRKDKMQSTQHYNED